MISVFSNKIVFLKESASFNSLSSSFIRSFKSLLDISSIFIIYYL